MIEKGKYKFGDILVVKRHGWFTKKMLWLCIDEVKVDDDHSTFLGLTNEYHEVPFHPKESRELIYPMLSLHNRIAVFYYQPQMVSLDLFRTVTDEVSLLSKEYYGRIFEMMNNYLYYERIKRYLENNPKVVIPGMAYKHTDGTRIICIDNDFGILECLYISSEGYMETKSHLPPELDLIIANEGYKFDSYIWPKMLRVYQQMSSNRIKAKIPTNLKDQIFPVYGNDIIIPI